MCRNCFGSKTHLFLRGICVPRTLSVNNTGNVRVNLTLSRVRVTILAVESNKCYAIRVCDCNLSYPRLP